MLGVALPWLPDLLGEHEDREITTEGEAAAVAAALVQRVCQALIAATADERVSKHATYPSRMHETSHM